MKRSFMAVALLILSLEAEATVVNCGTSGQTTSCSSVDVQPSNIVNLNSAGKDPSSTIIVNSPTGRTLNVSTSANSKSLQTNLFMNNQGIAANLSVDLSSKWDLNTDTNGLSSAANASNALIVADMIDSLNLNVSGYAGKSGKTAAQLCADKILAGEYGETQKATFKSRCNDGTTANPCADAKTRSSCDAQDLTNLNLSSGEVAGACPAGLSYLPAEDDNQNPPVSVTKVMPKPLRKCERPAYTTTARVCKWRTLECTYTFRVLTSANYGFGFRYPTGYNNPSAIVSVTGAPGVQGYLCLAYDSGSCIASSPYWYPNYSLGSFTIRMKNSDVNSTIAPECPMPVIAESLRGTWYNGAMTASSNSNGVYSVSGPAGLTILDSPVNSANGHLLQAGLAGAGNRTIDSSQQCMGAPYEQDAGIVPGQVVSADVGYVDADQMCPQSSTNGVPSYGNLGIVTNHNLTSTFTGLNGNLIDPLVVTEVTDCTKTDCKGINTTYTTSSRISQSISLGAGERGSQGGVATIFAYDIVGVQTLNFTNGSNGNNGIDNLTVNPVIKNCSSTSGNGTAVPQVQFHQTYWKLFNFTPSSVSYSDSYPVRSQSDAVNIFKKVSPGVQDLIKQSTCSTCQ